jgi:beta-lactamase class D
MRVSLRPAALAFGLVLLAFAGHAASPAPTPAARFAAYGHPGAFLLQRDGDTATVIHGAALADVPRPPASSFKVLLALIALETGALRGPDEILPGDRGHARPAWRRDMALREALSTSSEPYFIALAERIGRERLAAWVTKTDYGNGRMGAQAARAWHDGTLTVTARQQLAFVDRLRRGDLPFEPAHIAAVKAALRENEGGARLYAKTGTHLDDNDAGTAWWIGWVEGPRGAASFALMVDLKAMDDRDRRIALGKALLRDAGALPSDI